MKNRFRLINRGERAGQFYCVDAETGRRFSLKTKDRDAAQQIVVEAEAAKCEAQRAAEQLARDAKIASRVLARAAREKLKAEVEMAKSKRRRAREHKARMKATAEIAQCGINWTTMREAHVNTLGNHLVAGMGSPLAQPRRSRQGQLLDALQNLRPETGLHRRSQRRTAGMQRPPVLAGGRCGSHKKFSPDGARRLSGNSIFRWASRRPKTARQRSATSGLNLHLGQVSPAIAPRR